MLDKGRPVYTIGTAAEILGLHPRTLRLYEEGGLLRPARKNNRRFYSAKDLEWIGCVRYLLHEKGLNQEGMRRLLATIPCWEITDCPPASTRTCRARVERSTPCWDLARRNGTDSKCFECEAYLSAAEHVMDNSERREAQSYALAG
jgi:DNA-binding transcriptional MerR regulator